MILLVLALLTALAVGAFVIAPIVSRQTAVVVDVIPGQVLDVEARKRVALASLKEVEYDHVAGKLDEADYQALRAQLSHEAMLALRAADALRAEATPGGLHACGFDNPSGSRFCAGCGQRLS
jgi:hypothetical protein